MFHEFHNFLWGYFEAFKCLDGTFVDGASNSCRYCDDGVDVPTFLAEVLCEWVVFVVFLYGGYCGEFVMAVDEFNELDGDGG